MLISRGYRRILLRTCGICMSSLVVTFTGIEAGTPDATPPAPPPPLTQTPAAPAVSLPLPPMLTHPHAAYPMDQLSKDVEGRVVAHFKIDEHGRVLDGVLNYDVDKKSFAAAAADWLHAVRFKVPKGWVASDSPMYEMLILYVLCSDAVGPEIPKTTGTMVVTGCKSG